MAQSNKFLVTNKHGRVFRQVDAHTRVLVAIPGQEISVELARECGLLDQPATDPEPTKAPAKKSKGVASYPTKAHKAV